MVRYCQLRLCLLTTVLQLYNINLECLHGLLDVQFISMEENVTRSPNLEYTIHIAVIGQPVNGLYFGAGVNVMRV